MACQVEKDIQEHESKHEDVSRPARTSDSSIHRNMSSKSQPRRTCRDKHNDQSDEVCESMHFPFLLWFLPKRKMRAPRHSRDPSEATSLDSNLPSAAASMRQSYRTVP